MMMKKGSSFILFERCKGGKIHSLKKRKEAGTKVLASQLFFGLSSKTQWLSGLYYADFISFYTPTQLCGGGKTESNSNELPISVPLSFLF